VAVLRLVGNEQANASAQRNASTGDEHDLRDFKTFRFHVLSNSKPVASADPRRYIL
jgi:hypothetical protein